MRTARNLREQTRFEDYLRQSKANSPPRADLHRPPATLARRMAGFEKPSTPVLRPGWAPSSRDLDGPKADRLLWGAHCEKADADGAQLLRQPLGPKGDIECRAHCESPYAIVCLPEAGGAGGAPNQMSVERRLSAILAADVVGHRSSGGHRRGRHISQAEPIAPRDRQSPHC